MKFTAFVLATAAASAVAQQQFLPQQQFVQNPFPAAAQGVAFAPYQVQTPYVAQQPVYQIQQPIVPQDPLAWERDCTWISSIGFRNALSMATCGQATCQGGSPNGNGGGYARQTDATKVSGFHVWGSVINRAGRVCAVAYTGQDLTQQFPFGRIQAMKRANTANDLSLPSRAMPSHVADRHQYVDSSRFGGTGDNADGQPGVADNGWYGFSHDRFNPGNIDVQYQGATSNYGEACGTTRQDPMCMQKPGGYDYSAGGLALYDQRGLLRGAIGVSGDNDCTSHAIAWKARRQMNLHFTPANKDRADFNGNTNCAAQNPVLAACPNTQVGIGKGLTACEICNPSIMLAAPAGAAATYAKIPAASWGHTGAYSEDNVFFSLVEQRNFPVCYDVIRRFSKTSPTGQASGGTSKA